MTYGTKITYEGRTIATAEAVKAKGINYEIRYSSGYTVVLPASAMTSDLLALATSVG